MAERDDLPVYPEETEGNVYGFQRPFPGPVVVIFVEGDRKVFPLFQLAQYSIELLGPVFGEGHFLFFPVSASASSSPYPLRPLKGRNWLARFLLLMMSSYQAVPLA